jgi:hypothetical protein
LAATPSLKKPVSLLAIAFFGFAATGCSEIDGSSPVQEVKTAAATAQKADNTIGTGTPQTQQPHQASTPVPTVVPTPTPTPAHTPVTVPKTSAYYANCTEARAAGVAPIYAGEPGYASKLDRDHDGIACE